MDDDFFLGIQKSRQLLHLLPTLSIGVNWDAPKHILSEGSVLLRSGYVALQVDTKTLIFTREQDTWRSHQLGLVGGLLGVVQAFWEDSSLRDESEVTGDAWIKTLRDYVNTKTLSPRQESIVEDALGIFIQNDVAQVHSQLLSLTDTLEMA